MNNISNLIINCQEKGGTVYRMDKVQGKEKARPVLLISHLLDLTGAPIALLYMANMLQKMGYDPVIAAPEDGPLSQQIQIPTIVYPLICEDDFVLRFAHLFELIVCNTVDLSEVVNRLNGINVPVLWWVHEADGAYSLKRLGKMPYYLFPNVKIVSAGSWAKQMMLNRFPHYQIDELLYMIPDLKDQTNNKQILPNTADKTLTFALIGYVQQRKGQDILLKAVSLLSDSVVSSCRFVFVGRPDDSVVTDMIYKAGAEKSYDILYYPQIDRIDIPDLYQQIDCLICASRDDPMPLTVTEACQFSKLIICSENTGSATLLRKHNAGFVFENENASQLAEYISYIIKNNDSLDDMKKRSRELYETYFTEEVFYGNLKSIIEEMKKREYNFGQEPYRIIKEQEVRIQELQREIFSYRDAMVEAQEKEKNALYRLNEIENAFFWKISKPIRIILDIGKKKKCDRITKDIKNASKY